MPNSSTSNSRGGGGDRSSSGRTTKKRISDEEWVSHKEAIERLYLDEGRDVREVRDTMKRDYGFEAHEKAYKRKFEEWGLIKNIPKDEGLFMVKKRESRRGEEGKDTIFKRRRRQDGPLQLVLDEKIDRIADRYAHDLNSFPDDPATPDNIEYDTPDATPGDERPRPARPPTSAPSQSVGNPHDGPPQGAVPQGPGGWAFPAIAVHPTPSQPPAGYFIAPGPGTPHIIAQTQVHPQQQQQQQQPQNQNWEGWVPPQYF
ncbi:hypothetical protein BT63DRAFT_409768 [Microthyrium microscopicum]|uniref:Clr5 domain-containing protein n=1 Tax=Microthyrium microscopicum TaxID=703497 RepID=A0A6A6UMJ7_9PEZI|nr:hypothetical protein BT63DRAFT_409768 [Microthyrium microscopicum]